ncbi:BTAD domain-containing putative transcriptional regulator [Actinoplanes sp. NPDC051411]|uniref:ATP-binding protein n=1 Tax=Actinoplanes sp. NPDC051411 TaxID=3155522 RepID=UPI0034397E79
MGRQPTGHRARPAADLRLAPAPGPATGLIASDPAGYRITIGPDDLDSLVFARLAAAGRRDGDAVLLRRGLDLWRGDALSGIESETVRRAAVALDEARGAALEDWAELELAAGHERDLIGPLTDLVERFPLRERLRGQLIRALAGAGRTGDALAEFRRVRSTLRGELGLEPGPALQELHRRVLAGEAAPPPRVVRPVRSLPRTVADFTGRTDLISRIAARAAAGGPAVIALDGMAGSGKTTLALHVAAELGERYPDAHLYIDLHGHSEREPLDPAGALLVLLRRLGIGADEVPADSDGRVHLWRAEMARRRALVILDNAASSGQVVDLLPASPGSLVLVTSRRRLLGLDGAHPESLPVLDEAEAVELLARIAGDRVFAEPGAAADLVGRCGGLPLAIRLAGARLAHRPRWQVADLVKRVGDAALPELAAEDRTVAGAFALSFGQLPQPAQRVFRLLGVHPGRLFDVPAVAALADLPAGEAGELLDDLVDVHLVEEPEPDVFRMHDLLHEYASALAAELPTGGRRAALGRLLDLELGAALATVPEPVRRPMMRELGVPGLPAATLVAAIAQPPARLERMRPYLGSLVAAAVDAGRPEYSWQLGRAAWRQLFGDGYNDDVRALFTTAGAIARRLGDELGQAISANYLGSVHFRRAQYDDALALLQESIRLRRRLGNPVALAYSLSNLVGIYSTTSRFAEATEVSLEALRLAETTGDAQAVSSHLDSRSLLMSRLGRHEEALILQRRRLMSMIDRADRSGAVYSLFHLILIRRRAGRISDRAAERAYRVVLRLSVRQRMGQVEAEAHSELGDVLSSLGRHAEAIDQVERGLETFDRLDDHRIYAQALNTLARARWAAGDRARAEADFGRALQMAQGASQPYEVARAHLGLGDCATDAETARAHWTAAAEIFTRLRVPERYEAAARLQEVDSQKDETGVNHCAI